ncbi:microtubule-associated serine/threonine-protein kinase 4-like [Phyllobates terribilis]|uniref:microtubule-associated serine/threonine-protein kinase 4-like n=1 Tax=Phyllobates terribilis TaxID=111132 RepID=UPI003CCA7D75
MASDKSLLSAEMNTNMEEALYEQMLMKAKQEIQSRIPNLPESRQIRPQPSFCIKTRTSKNTKIFINICKSNQISAPPDLTEQELVSILESDDPSGYRVPMSLGEPHVEVDNSGGGCTAYDIVINGTFFEKIKNNELLREFFITVAMEGLENKYEMELSREWKMLKNRKFLGSIFEQNIRTKSKPMIQEMDIMGPSQLTPSKSLISEVESSPVKPDYMIVAEPPVGHPSFLVAEVSLPKVETAEGDTKDEQNLIPGLNSDLTTETTVLADADSRICEIPEIQESDGSVIKSLTPSRQPHKSDYGTSKLISSGSFGAVYLAHHKDSHQIFALKKMFKRNLNTPKRVALAFLERDILTFADCPFVVSMLCSFPTKSHLCMVMEYVGGGDCETLLSTRGPLSVPLARLYFGEAVLAVEYLHSYGVVHRDLKPDNLLITSAGHIKVTDFGISKVGVMIPKTNTYKELAEDITREFLDRELCGTPYYIAPEVILKEGYGRPVDWWSMGIILHKFLTGSVPFDGDSVAELYDRIVIGDIIWDCNSAPTPNAQNLITELLRTNPADRLGTGGSLEIKSHPFLSDLDFNNLLSQKPEYIPQLASDVDNSLFIDHSEIDHSVSEDEEGTSENNENLDFQNFTSSSERLSKLCTITTRTMNDEDQKSPPECTPATNANISEM